MMIINRRTFLGGAFVAASIAALPCFTIAHTAHIRTKDGVTADIPVSFEQAKATAAGIAGSTLIAYEGSSHGIVVTERDRVTADLQAFLAG